MLYLAAKAFAEDVHMDFCFYAAMRWIFSARNDLARMIDLLVSISPIKKELSAPLSMRKQLTRAASKTCLHSGAGTPLEELLSERMHDWKNCSRGHTTGRISNRAHLMLMIF